MSSSSQPTDPQKNRPICVDDWVTITSGKFSGYEVVVLEINDSTAMARVTFAVFGGTDAVPFEIELSSLSHNA